jgi:hypothetical protein
MVVTRSHTKMPKIKATKSKTKATKSKMTKMTTRKKWKNTEMAMYYDYITLSKIYGFHEFVSFDEIIRITKKKEFISLM